MALVNEIILSSNTGLDAIRRAPIVEENTGIHCLRIQDITNKKSICNWGYTSCTDKDFSTHQLKKNDIIMARTCSVGVNFFVEKDLPAVYNNGLARIRVNESICIPKFLYYVFKTDNFKGYMYGVSAGTSVQANIKLKDILQYKFWLPDYDCQSKIVTILDSIENKIENNNAINRNLLEQAQTYYDELFVKNAKTDWKQGILSDVGTIVAGGTPSKAKDEYYTDKGIAWITPRDLSVNKSVFITHGENDITEIGLQNSSATMMPVGTVLFSSRAPIGYIAIAANEVSTNQGFKSVVPNENVGTAYIYFLLKKLLPTIERMASGSTFKEISGSAMKIVPIIIPDDESLKRFAVFCNPIMQHIQKTEQESKRLADLRDNLLPKLMSGELDVSDLAI